MSMAWHPSSSLLQAIAHIRLASSELQDSPVLYFAPTSAWDKALM